MKTPKPKEGEIDLESKKKMLTIFILFFPGILVAGIPSEFSGTIVLPLILKVLLLFYQFIILKNFVDQHYS